MTIFEHSIYAYIVATVCQRAYMTLDTKGIKKFNRTLKKNFSL